MTPNPVSYTNFLLNSGSLPSWPDLSSRRHPPNDPIVSASPFPQPSPCGDSQAAILVAIARVVGFLADVSHVFVAVFRDLDTVHLVRVSWEDEQTWDDAVTAAASAISQHADEQALPLASIKSILGFSHSETPCIPVCNFTSSESVPGLPLTLIFDHKKETLQIHSSANSIHPSSLNLLHEQFLAFHAHRFQQPKSRLSLLPTLSPHLSSAHEREFGTNPPVGSIADYIRIKARSFPDHHAVRWYPDLSPTNFRYEHITYRQYHLQSNKYAHWLLANGLQQEDRVAISMNRDITFHVALIGILKAGGCYVPVDPELPLERKRYIVQDAQARFLLTASQLPNLGAEKHVCVDSVDFRAQVEAAPTSDLFIARPEGLSYLLYTSGTTGNPKGCLLTNRGLSEALWSISEYAAGVRMHDLSQGRYLGIASIAFDVHLAEAFVPLIYGMAAVTAPRSVLFEDLPFYIVKLGVSHIGIVPSLIEATMGAMEDTGPDMPLRYIASGGEKMSDAILNKWAAHPIVKLGNFYGPSEVTIGCCARYVDSTTLKSNIGTSFRNVSSFVVDSELRVLPRGAIGELIVEGPLVGKGYHGRPDLTSKAFVPWVLSNNQTSQAYRTGDLVRMTADGSLEIAGRIDTQIKLRGVRIEAEGVSSIVRKAASGLDACTILAKHPSIGAEQLVTFVSLSETTVAIRKATPAQIEALAPELLEAIRGYCDRELASYMRPSHIIRLSWLPLNSNGKLDEKRMRHMFETHDLVSSAVSLPSSLDQPLSEIEERILDVVTRYTRMDTRHCKSSTSVFECGLDSITMIPLTKDLNATFQVRLSAPQIMAAPRLAEIAASIHSEETRANVPSASAAFSSMWLEKIREAYPESAVEMVLPALPIQPGVIFRSSGMSAMYVQHVVVDCGESGHSEGLQKAWTVLMHENPILRTVFYSDSVLAQVILTPTSSLCPWHTNQTEFDTTSDFASWFMADRAVQVSREINRNIQGIPPYRIAYYEAPAKSYFVLSMHHALFDGISLSKLIVSAEKQFIGEGVRNEGSLTSIIDAIHSLDKSAARQFWTGQLKGFSWPEAQFSRAASSPGKKLEITLSKPLSALKILATRHQATLQSLFTSTFALLISRRIYHSDDVVFGMIRSGRLLSVDGIENAPYPVMAVVPCRVDFNASDNILQHVQGVIGQMVEYEHIGLADIQNWVRPGLSMFDTLFSVSVQEPQELQRWTIVESEPPQPDYLLSVEVVLNFELDTVCVRAAWLEADLPDSFVESILAGFESTADELARTGSMTPASVASSDRTLFTPPTSRNVQDSGRIPKASTNIDPVVAQKLRAVVCQFLGVGPASVLDDTSFLSLGLDSIRAIGLAKALRGVDGFETISAVDVMQNPSINYLPVRSSGPDIISEHQAPAREPDQLSMSLNDIAVDLGLTARDVVRVYETSTLQAGLLSHTVSSEGQLYIHVFPFVFAPSVDFTRLQDAWGRVVGLLDILRTSFWYSEQDAAWLQIVHSEFPSYWSSDTFSSESDYQEKVHAFHQAFNVLETDFMKSPLLRLRLYSPDANAPSSSARLVLILHHAMYDGISIGKLLDLVHAAYHDMQLPEATQFHELIPELKSQEERGASFWADKLLPYGPFDRSPLGDDVDVHSRSISLSPTHAELRGVCLAEGVTLQTLCQATFAKWLASIYDSRNLVFGRVVAGRTLTNAEDVIGPVLNTIPCIITLPEHATNAEFLRTIQADSAEALSWEHASLRSIQRQLGVSSRLWDALFVFQPSDSRQTENILEFDNSFISHRLDIQYPLNVEFHESAQGITIQAACRSDYMSLDQLDKQLLNLDKIMQRMISHPTDHLQVRSLNLNERVQTRIISIPNSDAPHHAPTHIEVPLAFKEVLSACLRVPTDYISSHSSLASLGIDSITAIQVASKCRSAGFAITAKQIISSRVIGDLVRAVQVTAEQAPISRQNPAEVPEEEHAAIVASVAPCVVQETLPTTPGMKWLLAGWQASKGTRFQHSFAWRLPQDIDANKLKHAWIALLERHPILRAAFHQASGVHEPRIVVYEPGFAPSTWSEISSPSADIEVIHVMKDQVTSPEPLTACQTRATLLSTPDKQTLIVHLHHAQYDAWSLPILMDDLRRLYNGEELGLCGDLRDLLTSLPSTETDRKVQQQFWESHLADPARAPLFPRQTEAPGSGGASRTICILENVIPDQSALRAKAQSFDVSVSALIMASWAQVQAHYSRGEASTFGLWTAGRTMTGAENAAVPYMNVLPVSVDTRAGATTEEIVVAVQKTIRERTDIIEQSDLVDVHRWIKADRSLWNVNMNIVHSPHETPTSGDGLFQALSVPYFIPSRCKGQGDEIPLMPLTVLFSDDLSIDVILAPNEGPITIALDASPAILSDSEAPKIIDTWKKLLTGELSSLNEC